MARRVVAPQELVKLNTSIFVNEAPAQLRQNNLRKGQQASEIQRPTQLTGNVIGKRIETCCLSQNLAGLLAKLNATLRERKTMSM